jgi:ketosteroid isomerase-like protein
MKYALLLMTALVAFGAPANVAVPPQDPKEIVYNLDTKYQAAVKANDAEGMAKILADDFVLVLGNGATVTRDVLLKNAREKKIVYERQDESQKTVRLFSEKTATVTALLWLKGVNAGQPFDYKLWYTDVYVKRGREWKYVLGQASLRLPENK